MAAAAGAGSGKGSTGGGGDAPVLPVVPFDACLSKFAAAEVIGLPACKLGGRVDRRWCGDGRL